ncbi:type I polyketide synthase [Chitinophaga filiformis]|uniref:Phosphopantetheine attachment site n=1 Tax=Chitinophaga filiformis TaxID=104663 RepID=A0A1G7M2W2_CHIFI|nr:SDR family NAD(P)-dependent oxidoreductase [Chitinophaga filiformis]SDF56003.1 Phosphopantetheine attachment site [Chitinophaga filiformis]
MKTATQSTSHDTLSSLQKSFLIIRNLERKLQEEKNRDSSTEEIAVVGMACHLPGGIRSPQDFWEALLTGEDLIADNGLTARWRDMGQPEDAVHRAMPHAGLLDDITLFDNEYFHISPAEARYIDPQQRQLLMMVANALADAGIRPESLKGSYTGVFTGISAFDYSLHIMQQDDKYRVDPYLGSGNSLSGASGRISYCYGFHGPCLSIDTACSSSLVALHQGAESLKRNECSLAVVSGANLVLSPYLQASLTDAGMLSPDGRCKAFDDSANGYVRSEGCLTVILKRLSDAVNDGDRIYACIKGSAVAQDGASGGLTVPDPVSQAKVIRNALQAAGMHPEEISFIEGHGTGTSLGDPVEAEGLKQVFGHRNGDKKLLLGSVKSNVGHLEAAAGLAGFMKACLSIYHRQLPPHLHFQQPNHHIAWEHMPFRINKDVHQFNAPTRMSGGVSSFGFTGTIAHCIVAACETTPAVREKQLPAPHFQLKSHWLGKLPGKSAAACFNVQWKPLPVLDENPIAPQYIYIETDAGIVANMEQLLQGKGGLGLGTDRLFMLDSITPVDGRPLCLVYDVSGLKETDAPGMKHVYQELLAFLQALQRLAHTPASILFITRHALNAPGSDNVAALQYSLTAFIRSASLEMRGPAMLVLDIDQELPDQTFVDNYVQQSYYREIACRNKQLWYPALAVTGLSSATEVTGDPDGTYLITGGRGSLGIHLAEWLVHKGAGAVIITGRSRDSYTSNHRIVYRQLDVTDANAVRHFGDWLRREKKTLKGIVHAAGTNSRCLQSELSADDIMYVAGPKIIGLQHLTSYLPMEGLDFLLTYSSIAAVWGSGMLSHYAAANAYMDAYVLQLRKQGIPAKTINWGPWKDSNMMLEAANSTDLLKESGVPPFNAGTVRRVYASLLVPDVPQLVYVCLDNTRFISMMEMQGTMAFWENLRPVEDTKEVTVTGETDLSLINDDAEREDLIRQELVRLVKQVLAIGDGEQVDLTRSFSDMGMDSILLVKYVQCINSQLGLNVNTNMLFNYPTIPGLAVYVNSRFRKAVAAPVKKVTSSLYEMSDEEVLKMVSEEMQKY